MLYIRVVKTSSGAKAVQVIYYRNRKRVIYKHIGSAKTDEELESLKAVAQDLIDNRMPSLPFFQEPKFDNLLYLDRSDFLGVYYTFLYEVISELISHIGLDKIQKQLLLDLVIIRIMEPASKLRSIELLDEYFGVKHRRQNYYRLSPEWLDLKSKIETIVTDFAQLNYSFAFDLLFYEIGRASCRERV